MLLERNAPHIMPVEDLQNGGWGDVSLIVPLKIEARSNGTVAAFFPNAKDQRNDLRGNAKPDAARSARLIPEAGQAIFFKALLPDIEMRPGNAKEAAGLTDVAAHALRML